MSQHLPYSGFNWWNQKEIDKFDLNSIGENCSDGYILEVDLEYLDVLHYELHNDYPLAPEILKFVMICCRIIVIALQVNMA